MFTNLMLIIETLILVMLKLCKLFMAILCYSTVIINVNSNETVFYPFSIKTSKCSGSRNNIDDPYAKICVPDVIKDLNIKVFNLILRTNKQGI